MPHVTVTYRYTCHPTYPSPYACRQLLLHTWHQISARRSALVCEAFVLLLFPLCLFNACLQLLLEILIKCKALHSIKHISQAVIHFLKQ